MTDPELVEKKLAFIETCVAELRRLARPEHLETDLRERRFVEHTLQLAIQAALDVASHVVSDQRLGEPRTNRALFASLATAGWVEAEAASTLGNMAGFRNTSYTATPRSTWDWCGMFWPTTSTISCSSRRRSESGLSKPAFGPEA